MSSGPYRNLSIESLEHGIPVILPDTVAYYKNNCMICFHENGHKSGVRLSVKQGNKSSFFEITWIGKVTEQHIRAHRDHLKYTDVGAVTIALLLVRELTDYTAISQSAIGTGFDYYLSTKTQDDDLIFNDAAHLEVSGILTENTNNTVDRRIRNKKNRLKKFGTIPFLIVVVEFSKPWSKMVTS